MKILIVGGGAREHALCWRVRADRPDAELLCAPGSSGIGAIAQLLPITADDVSSLTDWARAQRPDLVVVGPEAPLAAGLVDALRADGIRVFGPTKAAARIETDKAWTANPSAGQPHPVAPAGRVRRRDKRPKLTSRLATVPWL